MIGVGGLTYRRYVIRPTGLDNRREDLIILVWFLAVLGSGFVVEGLRIGGTELQQHPDWAVWSPVGAALAWVLDRLDMTREPFSALASSLVVDPHDRDLRLADVHWLLEAQPYALFATQYASAQDPCQGRTGADC